MPTYTVEKLRHYSTRRHDVLGVREVRAADQLRRPGLISDHINSCDVTYLRIVITSPARRSPDLACRSV